MEKADIFRELDSEEIKDLAKDYFEAHLESGSGEKLLGEKGTSSESLLIAEDEVPTVLKIQTVNKDIKNTKDNVENSIIDFLVNAIANGVDLEKNRHIRLGMILHHSEGDLSGSSNHFTCGIVDIHITPEQAEKIMNLAKVFKLEDGGVNTEILHIELEKIIKSAQEMPIFDEVTIEHFDSLSGHDVSSNPKYHEKCENFFHDFLAKHGEGRNKDKFKVLRCESSPQDGNTCGDFSVFNFFVRGILRKDPKKFKELSKSRKLRVLLGDNPAVKLLLENIKSPRTLSERADKIRQESESEEKYRSNKHSKSSNKKEPFIHRRVNQISYVAIQVSTKFQEKVNSTVNRFFSKFKKATKDGVKRTIKNIEKGKKGFLQLEFDKKSNNLVASYYPKAAAISAARERRIDDKVINSLLNQFKGRKVLYLDVFKGTKQDLLRFYEVAKEKKIEIHAKQALLEGIVGKDKACELEQELLAFRDDATKKSPAKPKI